jgi:hypothetical protein
MYTVITLAKFLESNLDKTKKILFLNVDTWLSNNCIKN